MISNTEFVSTVRRVIGSDALDKIGTKLKEDGAHKVLIHYGGGDYLYHGLLDRVRKSLSDAGLEYIELGGVKPNPRLSLVMKGIELCKENNVDYLLSIGGGSAVDSAKGISQGMVYDGDLWNLYNKTDSVPEGVKFVPVSTVVVYPATGAEAGGASVLCNEETCEKFWSFDSRSVPHFAFMDPQYTMTLPKELLAVGMADMLSHYTDTYLTADAHFGVFDVLHESIMHYLVHDLSHTIMDPEKDNLVDRGEMMAVASMGCDDSIAWGRVHEMASHQMAHSIGAVYDTKHGATLSIFYAEWLRYIYKNNVPRFARWAEKVWDVEPNPANPEAVVEEGIRRMVEWFHFLGVPTSFAEAGIHPTEQELDHMVDISAVVFHTGCIGLNRVLYKEDIKQIYKNSL